MNAILKKLVTVQDPGIWLTNMAVTNADESNSFKYEFEPGMNRQVATYGAVFRHHVCDPGRREELVSMFSSYVKESAIILTDMAIEYLANKNISATLHVPDLTEMYAGIKEFVSNILDPDNEFSRFLSAENSPKQYPKIVLIFVFTIHEKNGQQYLEVMPTPLAYSEDGKSKLIVCPILKRVYRT